jgi:hypothetical protein
MQFCRYVYMHKDLVSYALRYTQLSMQCEMAASGIEEGDRTRTASYPFRQCREDNEITWNLCQLPVRSNVNVFTDTCSSVQQLSLCSSQEHNQTYGMGGTKITRTC